MKIDLHSHTTASDGSLTPTELVQRAVKWGVDILAITDHDTINGVVEAQSAGLVNGVEVIPGIEFSVTGDNYPGRMHLLGYFIDIHSPVIKELVAKMVNQRNNRNPKMVAKLQALGFSITIEEVNAAAGGVVVGRPHIGKVLTEKGITASVDEAFALYLNKGCPAFVPPENILPAEALSAIQKAGGLGVLAHPYQLRCADEEALMVVIESCLPHGLDGIEVYYSKHDQARRDCYLKMARKYNLLISGGSDFHGESKPDIELGIGCGDLDVPRDILLPLRQAALAKKAKLGI